MNSVELLKSIRSYLNLRPLSFDELDSLYVPTDIIPREKYQDINPIDYFFLVLTKNTNIILFGEKGIGKTTFVNKLVADLSKRNFIRVFILFDLNVFSSEFLLRETLHQLIGHYFNLKKESDPELAYSGIPLSGVQVVLTGNKYIRKNVITEDIESRVGVEGNAVVIQAGVEAKAKKQLTEESEISIKNFSIEHTKRLLSFIVGFLSKEYGKNIILIVDEVSFGKVETTQIKKIGEEMHKFDRILGASLQYASKDFTYFGIFVLDKNSREVLRKDNNFEFYSESGGDVELKSMSDETLKSILTKRIKRCGEEYSLNDLFQDEESLKKLLESSNGNPLKLINMTCGAVKHAIKYNKEKIDKECYGGL